MKKTANPLRRSYRLRPALLSLLCLTALSCQAYRPVRLTRAVDTAGAFASVFPAEAAAGKGSADASDRGIRPRNIYIKKYLIEFRFPSPAERINNMGVQAALEGLFPEAANLFLETIAEVPGSAAPYNNLAVIYELFGKKSEAFTMYSKAFMLDPGSSRIRQNYLSFEESYPR